MISVAIPRSPQGDACLRLGQGWARHSVQRHIEGDGPTDRTCLPAGPPRHCLEAEGLGLPFWPLARLAQNEELGCTSREARSRRGLEQMTRRKREMVGLTNERDFPHLVELAFAAGGGPRGVLWNDLLPPRTTTPHRPPPRA